jgi:hypothetical protein
MPLYTFQKGDWGQSGAVLEVESISPEKSIQELQREEQQRLKQGQGTQPPLLDELNEQQH